MPPEIAWTHPIEHILCHYVHDTQNWINLQMWRTTKYEITPLGLGCALNSGQTLADRVGCPFFTVLLDWGLPCYLLLCPGSCSGLWSPTRSKGLIKTHGNVMTIVLRICGGASGQVSSQPPTLWRQLELQQTTRYSYPRYLKLNSALPKLNQLSNSNHLGLLAQNSIAQWWLFPTDF